MVGVGTHAAAEVGPRIEVPTSILCGARRAVCVCAYTDCDTVRILKGFGFEFETEKEESLFFTTARKV